MERAYCTKLGEEEDEDEEEEEVEEEEAMEYKLAKKWDDRLACSVLY